MELLQRFSDARREAPLGRAAARVAKKAPARKASASKTAANKPATRKATRRTKKAEQPRPMPVTPSPMI